MLDTPSENRPSPSASSGSCLQLGLVLVLWLVITGIVFGRLVTQLSATAALTQIPSKAWLTFPLIEGIVLVLLLLMVLYFWKSQPWRSMLLFWLAASGYVLLLAPTALIKLNGGQEQALGTIALSLVYLVILYGLSNRRMRRTQSVEAEGYGSPEETSAGSEANGRLIWMLVWLAVPLFGLSWLMWGALGSLLDTLLQLLAGLAFGWVVCASLQRLLLPGLLSANLPRTTVYLLGGFAAGTGIMIFASGLGYAFGGIQTLLAICLPALGWLAVGIWVLSGLSDDNRPLTQKELYNWRQPLLSAWMLVGLCAAFPLALIDPDELALVITLSAGEILSWGLAAAAVSGMIALLLAAILLGYLLATRKSTFILSSRSRGIVIAATIIAWLVALLVYFSIGQPGFFGEELFVQLDSQAELSQASTISDPVARRSFVYKTLVQHADASQADLRASLQGFNQEYTPYYLVDGIHVRGGPLLRFWLSRQPGVAAVLDVPKLRPLPKKPSAPSGNIRAPGVPGWNLTLIGADRVWQELGVTGKGILVGQSDSGVQGDHPELADSYRGLQPDGTTRDDYNWYDPWNATPHPTDIGGHGTHTLGSVLGDHTGVAPDAQWIACVNLARNLGNIPNYLDCMQFMLAPFPIGGNPLTDGDPSKGAQVLNNSWGCPEIEGCHPDSLLAAVDALSQAGVFVVASAGNDGPICSSLTDPIAIYDRSFSVAAADASGNWVFFSSVGPVTADGSGRVKPDILAPGEGVLSSMPNSTYGEMSGTSMAGPHVAGVVALMWSANPNLIGDIQRTRQILEETARPYAGPLPSCPGAKDIPSTAVGYGMLDAYAAVKAAMNP